MQLSTAFIIGFPSAVAILANAPTAPLARLWLAWEKYNCSFYILAPLFLIMIVGEATAVVTGNNRLLLFSVVTPITMGGLIEIADYKLQRLSYIEGWWTPHPKAPKGLLHVHKTTS